MLHSSRLDEFYAELMVELRFYLTVLSLEDREFEHPGRHPRRAPGDPRRHRVRRHRPAVQQVRAHIETNAQRVKEILAGRE